MKDIRNKARACFHNSRWILNRWRFVALDIYRRCRHAQSPQSRLWLFATTSRNSRGGKTLGENRKEANYR